MSEPDSDPPNATDSTPPLTPKMEDYLRHIYRLEQESNSRVSNSDIADRLGVTRATVSSMLDTLSESGLIERERYRPIRLTDDGVEHALGVIRRHRLVETMLSELFDYTISEVDAEADVLEHHLSPRLCREIERELDMPDIDPHGDPIPDANLDIPHAEDATSLAEVAESSCVEVTRILTQDDETLEYLVSAGIEPSVRLCLDEKTPIGMLTVTVVETGRQMGLPRPVASQILVTAVDGD
ncbi:Mn-dependent transcriptional regulator [Halogeometricum borinquense DSM 11551]|uniref:Mn-dependent transcriptional regulator n=2 Tax=Halogeometricum borinquense TaxID=60847 RepID=E4NUK7_HALBP|nr:metal-dependent transcriptional regulator [Halogeometricum borinquense]ADQ68727.1 Mn-dependent transcriptional regulator [Halogeometricum borinquense DSM 11551]ELY25467.1 Mn-dependent transcriptional regulator [Halogeometricum borinquense DSM 11551]RYJ08675.1 metal-dependent transcriptional regulator [Halogeometricum borinquense]